MRIKNQIPFPVYLRSTRQWSFLPRRKRIRLSLLFPLNYLLCFPIFFGSLLFPESQIQHSVLSPVRTSTEGGKNQLALKRKEEGKRKYLARLTFARKGRRLLSHNPKLDIHLSIHSVLAPLFLTIYISSICAFDPTPIVSLNLK